MLFNSYVFLLGFLPVVLGGFLLVGARSGRAAAVWLGGASLVFYGAWDPRAVPLLMGSIGFNYAAGRVLSRMPGRPRVLTAAVAANLLVLIWFKYAGFLAINVAAVTGLDVAIAVALPLGISFFTFTQIAYLVDTARGQARETDFVHYLLFVTYFPHLIAGPIIHHAAVMPQFARRATCRFDTAHFAAGAAFLLIGLCKKCFLADGVAQYAAPVFQAASSGAAPDLFAAWGGALAYTFQLYFDFSGYSDMAVGISLTFNIRLPLNFNSPYKATSIISFWQRWHISLSTFLRDYLYIPLGGNRRGPARRFANLFATMLIGGLWHGAGWTFVVWGALHGVYLMINHAWRAVRVAAPAPGPGAAFGGWALTFVAVVVAWVFFRAADLHAAFAMLAGMAGRNGAAWPRDAAGVLAWAWCVPLLAIAVAAPNSQALVARVLGPSPVHEGAVWRAPGAAWAVGLGAVAALGLIHLSRPAEFLYFNF